MNQSNVDGFERFRRERNRRRMDRGPVRPMGGNASVLRELEAAEALEVHNQQLTREVHEFFADATRTAANIVSRVAENAESQHEAHIGYDMSEFLQQTIRRAQEFMRLMQSMGNPGVPEAEIETNMHNIVGAALDGFRYEGTAQLDDKHIGQDPFATDTDTDTQITEAPTTTGAGDDDMAFGSDFGNDSMGFGAEPSPSPFGQPAGQTPARSSIDDHLVADFLAPEPAPTPAPQPAPEPQMQRAPSGHHARHGGDTDACTAWFQRLSQDTERLQSALKVLVRGGFMEKDEAKAIYRQMRG